MTAPSDPARSPGSDERVSCDHAERCGGCPVIGLSYAEQLALKRRGLERLQEIFMTEEKLDAQQVANLLAAFPKVTSAMVMLGDGRVLGGHLPDGYDLETALLAPKVMQSVRAFNPKLGVNQTPAFTLLNDRPVTLFEEGNVYILISHEGRGLLPGMRERIGEVARALDVLCRGC